MRNFVSLNLGKSDNNYHHNLTDTCTSENTFNWHIKCFFTKFLKSFDIAALLDDGQHFSSSPSEKLGVLTIEWKYFKF